MGEPARWFIGAATTIYAGESGFEDRPELAGEVERMAGVFARLGYRRVPGFGVKVVDRIVRSRRHGALRFADLERLGAVLRKARHFITAADYHPVRDQTSAHLRVAIGVARSPQQSLF